MSLWKQTTVGAWALVAVGIALWVTHDRSWELFGFSVPDGWRMWTSLAVLLLLHALVDLGGGVMAWLALRDGSPEVSEVHGGGARSVRAASE